MSSENVDTRSRILEATVRLLDQHGGLVRMGDIAKETGISRQAVYLHFTSRTDLLVAATRFVDEKLDLNARLTQSRAARSGSERLARYIEFWGDYIPDIYDVAKALLLAKDKAAAAAWHDRMAAMRDGCRAAVEALIADGDLSEGWTAQSATDTLWTLLQVGNWENLIFECGWSNQQYIDRMKVMAERILVK